MKVLIDNKIFYLEGDLNNNGLYVDLFHITPKFRGIGLSYSIWRNLQEKYKTDITLQAFFTLIPYYKKMGFIDLGLADNAGYHDLILKYNNMKELTLEQRINLALAIAKAYGLESEVNYCIEQGMTPEEALKEWDL